MKTTHTMVMESTQHPAGIIHAEIGVMQLKFPRSKKPLSPNESQLQSVSVKFGQKSESQINGSDKPIEWAGFNIQQNRLFRNLVAKPPTTVSDMSYPVK